MEPLESVLGRDRKNPSFPTFSRVVSESSTWSQDPTPPASGSRCPAQEVWDQPADGQKALSPSSQQDLRLSGSKRERGPHACHPHCPQRPVLPATRGGCLRSARASSAWPAGIRVLSPDASSGCRAGQRKGGARADIFMLLQVASNTQCWRPGSDFPRNSLDQRRTPVGQTS